MWVRHREIGEHSPTCYADHAYLNLGKLKVNDVPSEVWSTQPHNTHFHAWNLESTVCLDDN